MINAEPGGLNTIRFAEKGTLRLTFKVETEGAHGAYLHRTKSATRIAASLINALAAIEDIVPEVQPDLIHYLEQHEVHDAIDEAMGIGAADIMLKATLNIGTIHGGLKVNMIPSLCTFEADIRLPIGLTSSTVMEKIYSILASYPEASVSIQTAASNPAASCAHDHPIVGILARNAERAGVKRPIAIPSLGATDCKFWRYEGVPAYVFGLSPESMAAKDENVSVDEFLKVIKTHALSGWEYLNGNM
jgi:succinyl-diaminopimelate desuccinylase